MSYENVRSVKDLVVQLDSGPAAKYVFFWGHKPKVPGQLDQSCLSNWYPAAFTLDGQRYRTTEHYMMAQKARLFGDEEVYSAILDAKTPGAAKSLGRKVSGFEESIWVKHRFDIVVAGNLAKFRHNQEMATLLQQTGSKVLVEASPHDRIWGIGMGKDHKDSETPSLWNGLNLLGFALMEVRDQLAKK